MTQWPIVRMTDVCNEITVGHVGKMSDQYVASGVPFLRSQDIRPGRIDFSTVKFIPPSFHQQLRKSKLTTGDVVMVRTGYPGTAAVVPPSLPDANCADLVIARPGPRLDPHFLAYTMNSPLGRGFVRGSLVGVAQQHFNVKVAAGMKFPLPPLPIQRRIASILGAYDDLIEVNRRRIAVLEEMARRLFDEWFVHFRFPGHEGHEMVETEQGRLPKGWGIVGLHEVAEVAFGYPFKSPGFNSLGLGVGVVRIRDIPHGRTETFTEEPFESRYQVLDGDVLIGMDGFFHTALWSGGEAALNQRVTRLRPTNGHSQQWLLQAVLPKIKHLEATITGTTVAHLSARDLRSMRLVLPPEALLARADGVLRHCGAMIVNHRRQNRKLAASRDLLLPRLISGDLAVDAVEAALEQAA